MTSPKVRHGSLLAEDFKAGQLPAGARGLQGERGPAGQDATKLFAYIRDRDGDTTATVEYGSGVTAVDDRPGLDSYIVTFDRSLVHCVVQVSAGFGDPSASPAGAANLAPVVDLTSGTADQAEVTFRTEAGLFRDTSFMVAAFC